MLSANVNSNPSVMASSVLQCMHALFLVLKMLLLLQWSTVAAGQRMDQYCQIFELHTMCQTTGIGPACGLEVLGRGVSDDDASTIVRLHNSRRSQVAQGKEGGGAGGPQPEAANMLEMVWDEELAMIAQRHADQCVFNHDCNDCRKVERFSVGQNLYTESRTNKVEDTNWNSAIDVWYEEVNQMPKSAVPFYSFSPATGHYTQLVWGSTHKVGCGYIMYREGMWYKKLYTCNYGPAGNVIGTAMYGTGPPCSKCPRGTSCSSVYPGLCGTSRTSKIYTTTRRPLRSASTAATSSAFITLVLYFLTFLF